MEGAGRREDRSLFTLCLQPQEHAWHIVGAPSISTGQVHVQAGPESLCLTGLVPICCEIRGFGPLIPKFRPGFFIWGTWISTHGNCVPRLDSPQARLTWQMKAKACLPTHFEQCRNLRMSSLMKFTPKALSLFE